MSIEGPKAYPVVYDAQSGLQYIFQNGYIAIQTGGSGSTPTWTYTGSFPGTTRSGFAYGVLQNGLVLMAGGDTPFSSPVAQSTCATYNPSTGIWTNTGSLGTPRRDTVGITLLNGKFLIISGADASNTPLATCELYDPTTGTWSATGSLSVPRQGIIPILLPNGKVLATNGHTGSTVLATAEIYDPGAGTWSATTGAPVHARSGYNAVLLANGKVLIAGGESPIGTGLASCELYDSSANTFASTGSMSVDHFNLEVGDNNCVRLFDGTVLLAGGLSSSGSVASRTSEVYDPVATTWGHTAVTTDFHDGNVPIVLANGNVLLASGHSYPPTSTTEVYNPATVTWATTIPPNTPRLYAGFVKVAANRVLMFGGDDAFNNDLTSCEIYQQ